MITKKQLIAFCNAGFKSGLSCYDVVLIHASQNEVVIIVDDDENLVVQCIDGRLRF